jgi:hypothetical protein
MVVSGPESACCGLLDRNHLPGAAATVAVQGSFEPSGVVRPALPIDED